MMILDQGISNCDNLPPPAVSSSCYVGPEEKRNQNSDLFLISMSDLTAILIERQIWP